MEHLEPVVKSETDNSHVATPPADVEDKPEVSVPENSTVQVPEGPFEPSTILDLPGMSLDKLAIIEGQLASEFASLSKDFVDARAARTDYLLKIIDKLISAAEKYDREWSKIYGKETKDIEKVIAAPEHYLLGLSREKYSDDNLNTVLSLIVAPRDLDDIAARNDQLPFAKYFKKISEPYEAQLNALRNHYDYQNSLINNNVERYQEIIWEQYLQDMLDRRSDLIDKTHQQLTQLYEEYYGVQGNRMAAKDWNFYYRSVVSTHEMGESDPNLQARLKRENIDSYYDIDNRYFKKNKIQLTKTKLDALDEWKEFEAQQRSRTIPQCEKAKVKLTTCEGLSQDEVDDDILALRSSRLHGNAVKSVETPNTKTVGDTSTSVNQEHELHSPVKKEATIPHA